MKKNNIFYIFLSICLLGIYSSCSNNDFETEKTSGQQSLIEQKLNENILVTIGHNVMLDNFYTSLKKKPISVNKNILNDETALDSCIDLFITANGNYNLDNKAMTRGCNVSFPSSSFLKECIFENYALKDNYKLTRGTYENAGETPAYLAMFYDEFFNSKEVDMNSLDHEIITAIEKVKSSYPNLTNEELDGLFFVAGITYNSCVYWYDNSDKWVATLTQRQGTRSNWFWEGVKNGVKKWAKADGGGAIKVWTANRIAGVASAGTALLAGAAVGSAVGAWNNLPCWD